MGKIQTLAERTERKEFPCSAHTEDLLFRVVWRGHEEPFSVKHIHRSFRRIPSDGVMMSDPAGSEDLISLGMTVSQCLRLLLYPKRFLTLSPFFILINVLLLSSRGRSIST